MDGQVNEGWRRPVICDGDSQGTGRTSCRCFAPCVTSWPTVEVKLQDQERDPVRWLIIDLSSQS